MNSLTSVRGLCCLVVMWWNVVQWFREGFLKMTGLSCLWKHFFYSKLILCGMFQYELVFCLLLGMFQLAVLKWIFCYVHIWDLWVMFCAFIVFPLGYLSTSNYTNISNSQCCVAFSQHFLSPTHVITSVIKGHEQSAINASLVLKRSGVTMATFITSRFLPSFTKWQCQWQEETLSRVLFIKPQVGLCKMDCSFLYFCLNHILTLRKLTYLLCLENEMQKEILANSLFGRKPFAL